MGAKKLKKGERRGEARLSKKTDPHLGSENAKESRALLLMNLSRAAYKGDPFPKRQNALWTFVLQIFGYPGAIENGNSKTVIWSWLTLLVMKTKKSGVVEV